MNSSRRYSLQNISYMLLQLSEKRCGEETMECNSIVQYQLIWLIYVMYLTQVLIIISILNVSNIYYKALVKVIVWEEGLAPRKYWVSLTSIGWATIVAKMSGSKYKTKQIWSTAENFDICCFLIFDPFCQNFIFLGDNRC